MSTHTTAGRDGYPPSPEQPENQRPPLGERVAALEVAVEKENSWLKQSSVIIGLIALCLSVATGSYTIWEKTVFEPAEAQNRKIERVQSIVARLVKVNSDLVTVQFSHNQAMLAALARVANIEKLSLLEQADAIINEIDYDFGFYVHFLLASEHLAQGQNKQAVKYAEEAFLASNGSLMQAEARRGQGEALFASGETQDIEKARIYFEDAVQKATERKEFTALASRVNVLRSYTISEIFFGSCDRAKEVFHRLQTDEAITRNLAPEIQHSAELVRQQASLQLACRNPPHW